MAQKYYVCKICGNLVEAINESGVSMVCCGQNMTVLEPCSTDGIAEKHVPEVKVDGNSVKVVIGEIEHPMVEAHYIEWISIETKNGSQRKKLKPGDAPKAEFMLADGDELIAVYEHCNIHGLWKKAVNKSEESGNE